MPGGFREAVSSSSTKCSVQNLLARQDDLAWARKTLRRFVLTRKFLATVQVSEPETAFARLSGFGKEVIMDYGSIYDYPGL